MGSPRVRLRDRGGDGLLYSPLLLFRTKYPRNEWSIFFE